MSGVRRAVRVLLTAVVASASLTLASGHPAEAGSDAGSDWGDGAPAGHASARTASAARNTTVNPASGPDFELPFTCGQEWTGSSRAGHSPNYYSIDFNAPGDLGKPVLATAPGVVITAKTLNGSYGRYVVIDHGNGYSSLYGHMNAIVATVGQYVDQGDLVGYLGSSGNSTGPHLHFEERLNGTDFAAYFHRKRFVMNTTAKSTNCPDSPVAGDWNGDGTDNVGVFHRDPAGSVFQQLVGTTTTTIKGFGTGWDRTFTGDWDGDGRTDVGVRPPGSTVFVERLPTGALAKISYGSITALPIAGDWDGDKKYEIGTWRPDLHRFALRSATGVTSYVVFGALGDQPVVGDWNGDGRTDVGVYRASTRSFLLRTVATSGAVTTTTVPFGAAGDLPVTGDWNGDRIDDIGVWSPSTATFTQRYVVKGATTATTKTVKYGVPRG
jgi:hypothetical protein